MGIRLSRNTMQKKRIVCWFSCGAASAVATKLAIEENARGAKLSLVVARIVVKNESEDNDRFAADCERWFGVPILSLMNEKYGGSVDTVIEKERYLVGPHGAACTRLLKKAVRMAFQLPGDRQVFGYASEEQNRVDNFLDANADIDLWPILIEKGLMKADCLAMVERAGIVLPAMYLMGYRNNNCIGCVKGGAGYWNKIRVDFPSVFAQRAKQERLLNRTICKIGGKRVFLDELPVDAGHYPNEPEIQCGIFCEMAEKEMSRDIAA